MSRPAAVAVAFGVVFGFLLSWGTLTDPDTIKNVAGGRAPGQAEST